MTKTTQARAIPTRVAIAYYGPASAPITTPVIGTAYDRDGKIVIATAAVKDAPGVIEFKKTDRIRWSSEVEGVRGLHLCRKCDEPHPMRVGANARGTQRCEIAYKAQKAATRAAKKAGSYVPVLVLAAQAKEAERERKIETALNFRSLTRSQMIANTITNVWNSDAFSDEEKRVARIAALAVQYGMTTEQAMSRIGQGTVEVRRPVEIAQAS